MTDTFRKDEQLLTDLKYWSGLDAYVRPRADHIAYQARVALAAAYQRIDELTPPAEPTPDVPDDAPEARERVRHIRAGEDSWAWVLRRAGTRTLVEFPLTQRTGWYQNAELTEVTGAI